MKTRSGFVSNSSSSSFIVVGIYVDDPRDQDWATLIQKAQDGDSSLEFHTGYDSGQGVLGIYVESVDRSYIETLDLDRLQAKVQEAKTLFEDMGLDTSLVSVYNVPCEG